MKSRITVRVDDSTLEEMEKSVENGEFDNTSEAVRSALTGRFGSQEVGRHVD